MKVSVIVPVFQHWDEAAICLRALEAQTFGPQQMEIILVNNDPAVPAPADFLLPANARVIAQPKKGSYAARNAGLVEARGDILCFTDADCKPAPNWVETAVEHLEKADGLIRVGGPIDLICRTGRTTWCETYEKLTAFNQRRYIEEFHWSATANMCTFAKAFEVAGPFSEEKFSGGDSEWGRRANDNGIPITFVEGLRVGHPSRATWTELLRKQRRVAGSKYEEKLKKLGSKKYKFRYLCTVVFKLLLPGGSEIRRTLAAPNAALQDRFKAYAVSHLLRIARYIEHGRLLFTSAEPENR